MDNPNQTTQDLNPIPPVSPVEQAPTISNPINPPAGGSKSKLPIIIIGIILFLLVTGSAAGFYVFKQQSLKTTSKPTPTPIVQQQIPTPTPPPTGGPTANWKIYTDDSYNFSISYPQNFSVKPNNFTYTADMEHHAIISILENNPFGFNLTIGVYKNAGNLTAKQFIKNYFSKNNLDALNKPIDPNADDIYTEKTINNLKFTFIDGLSTVRGAMGPAALITKDSNAFFFISEASTSISEEKTLFDQILSTFKFTN